MGPEEVIKVHVRRRECTADVPDKWKALLPVARELGKAAVRVAIALMRLVGTVGAVVSWSAERLVGRLKAVLAEFEEGS